MWEQALRLIRSGQADTLLVVDLDRLTREPRDLEDAIELVEHYQALVVDVSGLNGSSWFDRSGNFQTDTTHVVERFSLGDADHINYEATIEDNTLFTRPWKISLPLYRRKEKNAQLNEFKCVEFAEELIYGNLRKK